MQRRAQQKQGLTALGTGLAFLPMTLLIALTSVVAGRAAAKVATKIPTVAGQATMAAGLLALCLAVSLGAPAPVLAVLMIPVGLGGAVAIPAVTALLLDSVPAERSGTASRVLNTSRQIGGALAIAIYGALLANQGFLPRTPYQPPDRRPAPGRDHAGQPHAAIPTALTTPRGRRHRPAQIRQRHHHQPNGATMNAWTSEELACIGTTEELQIASLRRDDALASPRTIWVVPHGDSLYVRSVNGPGAAWYRGTRARHQGRIQAGGIAKDVTFLDADPQLNDELDKAYRDKYRRYSANTLDRITSPAARSTTMELIPR
jgi:hypothetical protein